MDEYSFAKMEITEIISICGPSLEESANKIAERNMAEQKKMVRKQAIYGIAGLSLLIITTILFFKLTQILTDDIVGIAVMGLGVIAVVGFCLAFVGARCAMKAAAYGRLTDPKMLIPTLAESARKEALYNVLDVNWLCPHCSAANPKGKLDTCSCCGEAYNSTLVNRHINTAIKLGKIPPVIHR